MEYQGEEQRKEEVNGTPHRRRVVDNITMDLFPPVEHTMVALIHLIHSDVKAVKQNVSDLDTKLDNHMKDETLELAEAIAAIMNKSFPEGDPHGHRRHHEASIKAAEDKAEFWKKMKEEISKYGLIGLIGWMSVVAWAAFVKGPQ